MGCDRSTWCLCSVEICSCMVMGHAPRCSRCTVPNINRGNKHASAVHRVTAYRHFRTHPERRLHLSRCVKKHQWPLFRSWQPAARSLLSFTCERGASCLMFAEVCSATESQGTYPQMRSTLVYSWAQLETELMEARPVKAGLVTRDPWEGNLQ